MVDSVNIRQESIAQTYPKADSAESGSAHVTPKPGAGFPTENSFSTLNSSNAGQSVRLAVVPDEPGQAQTAPRVSNDFMTQTFEARLDGVRATVHDFNRKFNAKDIDLSDGRTLMLMFRGVMADIQARIGLEYIGDALTSRALDQRKRADVADRNLGIRDTLNQREIEVDSKTILLHEKNEEFRSVFAEFNDVILERTLLMQEQQNTGADHSEKIAQLDEKVVQITDEMVGMAEEIKVLAEEIEAKGELNDVDRAVLAEAEALLSISSTIMVNMDKLLGRVVQDFSSNSLETGEGRLEEVREAELQARLAFVREDKRLSNRKDHQMTVFQQHAREDVSGKSQSVSIESQAPDTTSQSLLHESDFEAIGVIFFPDSQVALEELLTELEKAQNKSDERKANEQALIEEAFSVILLSVAEAALPSDDQLLPVEDSSVTQEETPSVDQPVQSDRNRVEDHESPETYARLLLQQDMAQGSEGESFASLQQNPDGGPVKSGRQTMGEAVSELASVPEFVAAALKEKEILKAYLYSGLRG